MKKVYVIAGICDDGKEPAFLTMGCRKVYTKLEDAQAEMARFIQELDENGYDYDGHFDAHYMSAEIYFCNSHYEKYYIYEMELV